MGGVKTQDRKTQDARREPKVGEGLPFVAREGEEGKNLVKGRAKSLRMGITMKFFFPILCVAAAGFAGYSLEPSMRPTLTGQAPAKAKAIADAGATDPEPPPVTPPPVTPPPVAPPVTPPVTPPPVEPPPVVKNDPEPPPVTPPPVEPPPVVKNDPEPPMEEEPAAPPATPPAPSAALGPEDIVKLMQDSIRAKQVKEFTFDQVLGWKAGEEEEVDGEKYQTGVAAYKAETIFGVKTIQAKALIQGGEVKKWIWPNSGMEIK